MARNILILGASYGSLLATKLLMAGHNVTLVCRTKTADLEAISFKVPPAFRKRFRQRTIDADLKLNELLFAALDAWEEKQNLKG